MAGLRIGGAPFFLHQVNLRNPAEDSPERLNGTITRIEALASAPSR